VANLQAADWLAAADGRGVSRKYRGRDGACVMWHGVGHAKDYSQRSPEKITRKDHLKKLPEKITH
jgi:hypothetical protein